MSSRRLPLLLGLAAASGLLLFLADYPVHAWPLQLVALVPLLVGLHGGRPSRKAAALTEQLHSHEAVEQRLAEQILAEQ